MHLPSVSVIVATFNEVENVDHVMDVALTDRRVIEVLVADGGSTDGTVERVQARSRIDPRVQLHPNPDRVQSIGLNAVASQATGDLLVRLDAHTRYAENYVTASIDGWVPGSAVGGPMVGEGATAWERSVAAAMADPIAIGPGRFRHATQRETVDTVYLGTFARVDFLDTGGYRTFPSGTVEDADFYARWRASGRTVVVDPDIRSWYRPRSSWRQLARQYWRYGQGKSELLIANGRLPSPRPLAPAFLVAGMLVGVIVGLTVSWIPLIVLVGSWTAALAVVGIRASERPLGVSIAAATMHLAYGSGLWVGLLLGFGKARSLRTEPTGSLNR